MGKKSKRTKNKGVLSSGAALLSNQEAALRDIRATGYHLPAPSPPAAGALPNPRILFKNTAGCNHGGEIAAIGPKVRSTLHLLIVGLNAAIERVLGTVEDASELNFRATSFTRSMMKGDFDEVYHGKKYSKELTSSLVSFGTDLLLMGGDINEEEKLKMAAAIAGMVREIEGRPGWDTLRKRKDVLCAGERLVVSFFNKRTSCGCLQKKYEELKETQEKMIRCDVCKSSIELKQIMQCSRCKMAQVCR